MQKRILLPTDFSKNALNAMQYAMKMFDRNNCDFFILNTYSEESYGLDGRKDLDPDDTFNKMSANRSKKLLGEIMFRLMSENENSLHRFHVISRGELLINAVKSVVEELNIDIVVMGAKGATDEREGKYGLNTLAVIETIRDCPVLVIPKNANFVLPEEIVLATNFDSRIKAVEFNHLTQIAKLSNAKIQILSLLENQALNLKQRKNKKRLKKLLKGIEYNFSALNNVNMATALNCYVKIRNSNMISYIDKKPSFWEQFGFGKPSLHKLGYYEDVPVLALHE